MVTVNDLLSFIAANTISPDTEVQVVRNILPHDANRIDVEAITVSGLGLTSEGWLRIDVL